MRAVGSIVRRNLRLFFRDRMNVFFSLLGAIILFVLYTLFLARLQIDGLGETFPDATEQEIRAFVDSWMFAGIVMLTTITTGLGALASLVEDGESGRFRDFLVSPVRRVAARARLPDGGRARVDPDVHARAGAQHPVSGSRR